MDNLGWFWFGYWSGVIVSALVMSWVYRGKRRG